MRDEARRAASAGGSANARAPVVAPGLEGTDFRGDWGAGGDWPVPQNKRCLEDAVPGKPKKIGDRGTAVAKVLRSSFLCLEVRTPIGADGFLRPERCGSYIALALLGHGKFDSYKNVI
jgi:hypothetical protein